MTAICSLACSCTSAIREKRNGFLDGYYQELKPGPPDGAKERWFKTGIDFSRYNKVMLDSVTFYLAEDSENKGIDAEQMKELADSFNMAMVNDLKDTYPVVTEPGKDVIRIRIAITDIKLSKPVISTITTVVPVGLGISIIKRGVTGGWSGSGRTGVEFMVLDSMTNEVIAAGTDIQKAGFTERFTRLGSAKEAFDFWAARIRYLLDKAHNMKKN
jgi:hypothetical protein